MLLGVLRGNYLTDPGTEGRLRRCHRECHPLRATPCNRLLLGATSTTGRWANNSARMRARAATDR